jgi:acetyl-CoA carboxylase biotin carboxyl carrier protein
MNRPVRPDEIEALVADFEASGCTELHIRFEGFELHLSADPAVQTVARQTTAPDPPAGQAPAQSPQPAPSVSSGPTGADDFEGFEIVRAPYLGTFYRAPKPGEASYVEIGSVVTAESELCLVEVMKLFTAIRAGVGGTIGHVLATDGQMVEAGQPLFAIEAMG